ncbi:hypothetical protein V1523DRAFT_402796 [Lipomyces doorenjongii]
MARSVPTVSFALYILFRLGDNWQETDPDATRKHSFSVGSRSRMQVCCALDVRRSSRSPAHKLSIKTHMSNQYETKSRSIPFDISSCCLTAYAIMSALGQGKVVLQISFGPSVPIWDTPISTRAVKFKFKFEFDGPTLVTEQLLYHTDFQNRLSQHSQHGLNMNGLLNTVSTCTVIYYFNIAVIYAIYMIVISNLNK